MEKFVKLQQSLDALFGKGTSKFLPKDLGGTSTTKQITKAMIDILSGKKN